MPIAVGPLERICRAGSISTPFQLPHPFIPIHIYHPQEIPSSFLSQKNKITKKIKRCSENMAISVVRFECGLHKDGVATERLGKDPAKERGVLEVLMGLAQERAYVFEGDRRNQSAYGILNG